MFFGMTFYQVAWFFLIYSVCGWILEVVFHAVCVGKIVNRGFLNGPVCPIYGFGVLSVFALIDSASQSGAVSAMDQVPFWELFLGGTVLATAVELFGGWLLFKLFHARWWDYSDKPFNFHGYICLEFSLIWGLCIAFVVRMIQPYFDQFSSAMVPERIGWPILISCYLVYLADFIVTVLTVNRLNRRLAEIDRLQKSLRTVSDGMTRVIGGSAYKTREVLGEQRERVQTAGREVRENVAATREKLQMKTAVLKESVAETSLGVSRTVHEKEAAVQKRVSDSVHALKEELYAALHKERFFGIGRLLRAFPDLRHADYEEELKEVHTWMEEQGQER